SVGDGVSEFAVGERVTVEPLLVCNECDRCKSGRYNACESLRVMGCHADGAYADFLAVPAEKVLRLPDSVSFEDGALIEPAAVAHHAARRANLKGGESILLFGAGPIGLFTLQMLKAYGAGAITCVDLSRYRLQLALSLGADGVVDARESELACLKHRRAEGKEFDLIVDCVGGKGKALDAALDIAAKGSRILAVGILEQGVCMQYLTWIAEHELELIGSFTYVREDFERTIQLLEKGSVRTQGIGSHRFKMEDAAKAFRFIESPDERFVKAILVNDAYTG
ncbi:MAG TPA: zinc-binding dehydrogenase, partial [bacterium]|nr:zinc-binding dehydrogenase [bacterium]